MASRLTRGLTLYFLVVMSLVPSVRAATVAPPADLGELARVSRTVVLARAVASWSDEVAAGLPSTATRFERLRQVAGEAVPDTFVVSELGGVRGGVALAVGGTPRYEPGRTYLLFLDRLSDASWRSRMMAYGLLVEEEATGRLVPLPEAAAIDVPEGSRFEPVTSYEAGRLLEHLGEVARGAAWSRERAGGLPAMLLPPPAECDFLKYQVDNLPVRWFGYETAGQTSMIRHTTPGQTGIADGGVSAVMQGAAAWTNHDSSVIRNNYTGSMPRILNCLLGEENAVWFNDPCSEIADLVNCQGTLAFGGAYFLIATQPHDGEQWHPAVATFAVVNNGTQCAGEVSFREMMTHELGHAQGFGHHAVAPPPNNPTMSALLKADGRGAALVGADKTCAAFSYHTFLDVPLSHFAWRYVEAVENRGVTSGCGNGNYCPDASVTRDQMAVFLLLAREGPTYSPPPCTVPPFNDVPVNSPFCRWIRELAARNITGGCGGGNYCPSASVTRDQMSVFLLRTREGGTYNPPACSNPTFTDVPCSNPFSAWIYELVRRGITGGCGGGRFCPTGLNTRAQMAIFLTATFGLPLPN